MMSKWSTAANSLRGRSKNTNWPYVNSPGAPPPSALGNPTKLAELSRVEGEQFISLPERAAANGYRASLLKSHFIAARAPAPIDLRSKSGHGCPSVWISRAKSAGGLRHARAPSQLH